MRGKGKQKCLPTLLGSPAGLGSYRNVVLKKIKKISAILANTELCGKLYLKAELICFKVNNNLGRETTS